MARKPVWFFIVIISLGGCLNLVQAAEIKAILDRNPVSLNESFQLTFTADADPDASPDFSPLQQQFEILNQQTSSSSSWVNGKSQHTQQWVLSLMAKQAGQLLIPPISFGDDHSQALRLTVNQTSANTQMNDDLYLDVQVSNDKPYLQAQLIYTLRLYRRVQIAQASLTEPDSADVLIEKLGDDSQFTTQIKGVDYAVTERKYALFPQKTGVVSIAPLSLNAEVVTGQTSRNSFFSQPMTQSRRVVSKPVSFTVQDLPQAAKAAAGLSAQMLKLTEQWSNKSLEVNVGEPLTRTISLIAKGTTVGQLPEFGKSLALVGIKTYPDQPQLEEHKQNDGITAIRQEKIAYIASQAGEYLLPALEVTWFNTESQQVEQARLPEVKIKALAVLEPVSQLSPALVAEQPAGLSVADVTDGQSLRIWQLLSAGLALGWAITVWWFKRQALVAPVFTESKSIPLVDDAAIKRACQANDPQAAKQALLAFFAAENLNSIVSQTSGSFAEQLKLLNQQLYAGQRQNWDGTGLWLAFQQRQVLAAKPVEASALQPLFKL